MFQLEKHFFGEAEEVVLKSSSDAILKYIPAFGANIRELFLLKSEKPLQILEGFQTFEQLQNNEKSKGIFLIPFPNRIRDGKYSFEGKEYQLPINKPKENNAIHGFIWNRKFDLVETLLNENSATIKLQHQYNGGYEGFPFPFLSELEFQLSDNELKITVSITNTGNNNMPLGIGWHPYFTFQKKADELMLTIPACNVLETDEKMIPTGSKKIFDEYARPKKIENTSFDTCFEFADRKDIYETKISDSEKTVTVWQDNSFHYLQVYIAPDRNSIALEPMTCPANAFNSKENLLTLKSNEKFEGSFGVKIN
jgi:aldose 1-epimerase